MTSNNNQREKLLQALLEIGREFSSTIDLEELLNRILQVSRDIFGFDNAIIRLLEPADGVLVTAASYGYEEAAANVRIPIGEGVMGSVAQTEKPLLVDDLTAQNDYIPGINDARSELAVPLLVKDRLIGVYNVESTRPHAFSSADIPPLMILAGQAAVAIENARLYRDLRLVSEDNRSLHQLNQRIVESAGLGIYTVDTDLVITSWNSQMEKFAGLSRKEVVGQKLFKRFPTLREEGFEDAVRQVLRDGSPGKLRLAHRNVLGELRFQKRRLAPLRDGDELSGVLIIVEDITEFRRLLDQTVQSEKLVEVGRLASGIAHEINNPLAVIAYAVQLLQREDSSLEERGELLERISSETERLKTLTGGLLSFSRRGETRLRCVDLNKVIKEVLLLIRYELDKHVIQVHENYAPIPLVQADSNKLKQVFINLFLNSAHALKGKGRIDILTRRTSDGGVEAVVSDDGPGVPFDLRDKVFEPFFTTKREGEGTGLGLYLCRSIINEFRGELSLRDSSVGATFSISFPPEALPLAGEAVVNGDAKMSR